MRSFRNETGLYLLALIIGLSVRLVGLGSPALSDQEAKWALQALETARGTRAALGSNSAYVVLTSMIFFAFGGASNALARMIPALVGSALILVPRLFAQQLKPRPALILAFALAFEPGLAALSRQAGSAIMVVTFALAAWGLWEKRQPQWAGVCAGMALLSGPALWPGLLGTAITWALLRPLERERGRDVPRQAGAQESRRKDVPTAGFYAAGVIVLIGTMFMSVPAGLGAWIAGLPEYVAGWRRASDTSIGVMLASLIAYQPLGVLLALIATVRGWIQRSVRVRRLSTWMVVALLVAIFMPAREVTDLAWMLIPLWSLASLEAARQLNIGPADRREVLGAVALTSVILVFAWLDYLALLRPGMALDQIALRTWLLGGSLFLLAVSLLLVGVGWSVRAARHGAVWGLAAVLGVYSFGALMAAVGHRVVPNAVEMWRAGAQLPMADLVLETVQEQSAWGDRDPNAYPLVIVGVDSPALQWLLRDRPVDVRSEVLAAASPEMVITADEQDAALVSSYRGQSFVWRSVPLWGSFRLREWLPFHEMAQQPETVILWVRGDLFPDTKPRTTP